MAKLGLSLQWKGDTTHINQSIYILHEQIKRQNHMLVLTDGGKTFKNIQHSLWMKLNKVSIEGTYFKSVKTIYEDNKN